MRTDGSRRREQKWVGPVVAVCGLLLAAITSVASGADRETVSLDGQWQIAKSDQATPPTRYGSVAPVPGLADLAQPPLEDVGRPVEAPGYIYYRRRFAAPASLPECALLKIHKAKYGTTVWLNGHSLGQHLPSFTPSYWDLREHLKPGTENELVVRVGAGREVLPQGMPTGWDFEKYRYLPGIYDSVEFILCDGPRIANVQCVPEIEDERVRLLVELCAVGSPVPAAVRVEIAEAASGRVVARGTAESLALSPGKTCVLDLSLPLADCRLWWPESPFLYEARLSTAGDSLAVRFGMRSFRFDPVTKRAVINGQQRYLCGSNVTVYRFFEDALRGNKAWDRDWVRKLHRQYKTMHWDTLRYCIGFPPDFWYDIADEEGFLIQDEFPIWTLGDDPEKLEAVQIVPEYVAWMRERWNHPSVVIWDAQNESRTGVTGLALQCVRHLDYSNRPWENGWAKPQSIYDCVESHPYLFSKGMPWKKGEPFRLAEIPNVDLKPTLQQDQKALDVPIIINEYDWLWLTRDGNPTCLTKHNYDFHVGPDATVEQRRRFHARGVAALTEFWRAHRQAAAVLHFCGLGYSRPGDKPRPEGGATSDDFLDLATLEFEPMFKKYVGMAFNPVGIMLDFWKEELPRGTSCPINVSVINDRQNAWRGQIRLRFKGQQQPIAQKDCQVDPLGRRVLTLNITTPRTLGDCTLIAELVDRDQTIQSLRDFEVVRESAKPPTP